MRPLSYLLLAILAFTSCRNNHEAVSNILSPDLLPWQQFTVLPQHDTIIKTSHGTHIRIFAESFEGKEPVTIRVREAFTTAEIVMAGLNTTSNNQVLSSDGMIYFEAVNATIKKPVSVKMPRSRTALNMQLFKGETNASGRINWIDPQPLAYEKNDSVCLASARMLWREKCNSCHSIFKNGTGPGLYQLGQKAPWNNLDTLTDFINNTARYITLHPYSIALKSKYGSSMTSFPDLSKEIIACLVQYLNIAGLEEDYFKYQYPVKDSIINDTSTAAGDYYDFRPAPDTSYTTDTDSTDFPSYDFLIAVNGWYNIDYFLQQTQLPLIATHISVAVEGPAKKGEKTECILLLPRQKLVLYADPINGKIDFGSDLTLPVNEPAVLLTIGKKEDSLFYSFIDFNIRGTHHFNTTIQPVSMQRLQQLLQARALHEIEIYKGAF